MKINNHILPDKVSILGTEYKMNYVTEEEDPTMKGNDGYVDTSVHAIFIEKSLFLPSDNIAVVKDLPLYGKKVIRHEIIHAFLEESGLAECCSWAKEEMLVDWIARQFPKMLKVFTKADIAG